MGELTVLGLGPGAAKMRTVEVQRALDDAELIVGYNTYVEPLKAEYPEKEFAMSGMMRETERCRLALEAADGGRKTVLVSSGDPGVYGMAGLVLELAPAYPEVQIRILPGVTAALSGSALLGDPIGHDFAVISLSDRLTPWSDIEARLFAVSSVNMPIVLYNPASRTRKGYLQRACRILLQNLPGNTPCGMVRNIGRDGETAEIMTLERLAGTEADMFTTVFIGDRTTKVTGGYLVTPRGYLGKTEDGNG